MGAAVFVSAAILQKAMEVAGCHTTYRDDDAYEVVVEEKIYRMRPTSLSCPTVS